MAILLNDRPLQDRVISLKKTLENYWADAKNYNRAVTNANSSEYVARQIRHKANIVRILKGRTIDSFETSFKEIYGWTQSQWDGFLVSAKLVHETLVESVLLELKNKDASISASRTNSATGDRVFTNPISGQLKNDIEAKLQLIIGEFTL